jgi:hypothetical protein
MNNIINISHYDMHTCNIYDSIIIIIIIKFIILLATSHIPVIRRTAKKLTRHCTAYIIIFLVQVDLLIGHTNGHLITIIF